jgi:hypothetical protein
MSGYIASAAVFEFLLLRRVGEHPLQRMVSVIGGRYRVVKVLGEVIWCEPRARIFNAWSLSNLGEGIRGRELSGRSKITKGLSEVSVACIIMKAALKVPLIIQVHTFPCESSLLVMV